MYFMYFSREGTGEVLLYLGDWLTAISVSYAAAFRSIGCVAQTTSRREVEHLRERQGEGGEDDLDLGGLRVGGSEPLPRHVMALG